MCKKIKEMKNEAYIFLHYIANQSILLVAFYIDLQDHR